MTLKKTYQDLPFGGGLEERQNPLLVDAPMVADVDGYVLTELGAYVPNKSRTTVFSGGSAVVAASPLGEDTEVLRANGEFTLVAENTTPATDRGGLLYAHCDERFLVVDSGPPVLQDATPFEDETSRHFLGEVHSAATSTHYAVAYSLTSRGNGTIYVVVYDLDGFKVVRRCTASTDFSEGFSIVATNTGFMLISLDGADGNPDYAYVAPTNSSATLSVSAAPGTSIGNACTKIVADSHVDGSLTYISVAFRETSAGTLKYRRYISSGTNLINGAILDIASSNVSTEYDVCAFAVADEGAYVAYGETAADRVDVALVNVTTMSIADTETAALTLTGDPKRVVINKSVTSTVVTVAAASGQYYNGNKDLSLDRYEATAATVYEDIVCKWRTLHSPLGTIVTFTEYGQSGAFPAAHPFATTSEQLTPLTKGEQSTPCAYVVQSDTYDRVSCIYGTDTLDATHFTPPVLGSSCALNSGDTVLLAHITQASSATGQVVVAKMDYSADTSVRAIGRVLPTLKGNLWCAGNVHRTDDISDAPQTLAAPTWSFESFTNGGTSITPSSSDDYGSYQAVFVYAYVDGEGEIHRSAPSRTVRVRTNHVVTPIVPVRSWDYVYADVQLNNGPALPGEFEFVVDFSASTSTAVLDDLNLYVHPPIGFLNNRNSSGQVYLEVYTGADNSGGLTLKNTFDISDTITSNRRDSIIVALNFNFVGTAEDFDPAGAGYTLGPAAYLKGGTARNDHEGTADLYTDIGELPATPPPPPAWSTVTDNRMWLISGNNVWASKPKQEGLSYEFNPTLKYELPEQLVSIARLDNKVVVFGKRSAFVFAGAGPDRNGNGVFSRYQLDLGSEVQGPATIETPQGILYQTASGLHFLGRGLEAKYVGSAVVDSMGPILGGAFMVAKQRIEVATTDKVIHWDTVSNQWTKTTEAGVSYVAPKGDELLIVKSGALLETNQSDRGILDFETTPFVETSWFKLNGLSGYGRLYHVYLYLEHQTSSNLDIRLYYDENPNLYTTYSFTPAQLSSLAATRGGPLRLRLGPESGRGRCSSFKLRISSLGDNNDFAPKLIGLGVDVGVMDGGYRGSLQVPESKV